MLTTLSWVPKGGMKSTPILSTDSTDEARRKLKTLHPEYVEDTEEGAPLQNDSDNEEVNDTLRDIAGGGARAVLEQVEGADEEEAADIQFKESDLVLCVAAADPNEPRLEVYTYDEPEDNLFLHHDAGLAAFPLCSSWLTDGTMSMLAVGTMLPFIEIWALDVMDAVAPAVLLGGCAKAVLSVRWNAVAQNILASGSADHTIKLWDLNQPDGCLGTYREAEKIQSLDWHPTEANHLLSGAFDHQLVLRDCRAPTQGALRYTLPDVVEHVEFVPEGSLLMASTSSGHWACYDSRQSGEPLWHLSVHGGDTTFHCSRQVPGLYATGGKDGEITLWDGRAATVEGPRAIVSRAYGTGAVLSLGFHPNSPHILGACGASGQPLVYTMTSDLLPVFGN